MAAPTRPRGLAATGRAALALLVLLAVAAPRCRVARAQQQYEANKQLNCYGTNGSSVLGYTCNATAAARPCASYVVFRSSPPYDSPVTISYLLNATPAALAGANAVPTVSPVAASRLVLAPLNCGCAPGGYYQHNTSYTIQFSNETYFITANITYQGLTTCQALIAQNPNHDSRKLVVGNNLTVPIRCACPSPAQAASGVRHLLTYLVTWGDGIADIAARFRVDAQAVLHANNLTDSENIYPFTTLLIPLKSAPTPDMLVSPAPPPAPAPPQAQQPPPSGGSGSGKGVAVGVGVGVGVLALAGLLGLMFLCVRRRRRPRPGVVEDGHPGKGVLDVPSSADYDPLASGKHTSSATTNSSSSSAFVSTDARAAVESLTVYKYSELEKATAGFSEDRRVKDASVYRAVINGDAAAVKRVAGDVSGEVGILKRVNHSSLVRLSGLCVHHGDTYLVFEFAENGALSNWLHGGGDTLVWKQRVQAAFDVADGLNYLHHYSNPPCVHKNLKSSNVLLDADLRAKVSSFALARSVPTGVDGGDAQLTRHVVGTQGYLAPEYLEHGLITPKLDVFAFGVILLELLSGKEATFDGGAKRGETLLWESAEGLVVDGEDARGKVRAFMDSRLNGDYPLDLAVAVASLAVRCVAREPRGRPSMDEVFVTLSAVYNSTLDWDPSDYSNSRSSIVGR
ncbi:protein LYK5 [Triticum aestivum]|uniref:protein LYK5 n=1 Tax=Triticum aestivum TaxID=4565 RepID=UPI001D031B08|nr:protein LYK5-like [Triticum aestivum]